MNKRKWVALDSWAYVKDDATSDNIEATRAQFKQTWAHKPGMRVRVFKRVVRAGGVGIRVTCVVVQCPVPTAAGVE